MKFGWSWVGQGTGFCHLCQSFAPPFPLKRKKDFPVISGKSTIAMVSWYERQGFCGRGLYRKSRALHVRAGRCFECYGRTGAETDGDDRAWRDALRFSLPGRRRSPSTGGSVSGQNTLTEFLMFVTRTPPPSSRSVCVRARQSPPRLNQKGASSDPVSTRESLQRSL